jgi:choline dehydrogenase-like flavoprotein
MLNSFSENEKNTLLLLCETFTGKEINDKAALLSVLQLMLRELNVEEASELAFFLRLLEMPLLNFFFIQKFGKFSELDLKARTNLLRQLADAPLSDLRKGYATIKKIALFSRYGFDNDFLKSVSYEPSERKSVSAKYAENMFFLNEKDCDVLIIGSGVGGSVAANVLAKKGLKVIVAEKGGGYPAGNTPLSEGYAMTKFYDKSAALSSKDGVFTVFAGSALGGGTAVNWAGCLPLPAYIREEWSEFSGIEFFCEKVFDEAMEYAFSAFSATAENIVSSRQNILLKKAAEKKSWVSNPIPQNLFPEKSEVEYGFIGLGDPYGVKRSTDKNLLKEAVSHSAEILLGSELRNIVFEGKKAVKARFVRRENEAEKEFFIRFRKIILAAGALHTPAICMRSGLRHPEIGKNLFLHPTYPVPALYGEKIEAWKGMPMTLSVDEFIRKDGNYGFKIETPPIHPGLMSVALPWFDTDSHAELMRNAAYIGGLFALLRDRRGGAVSLNREGKMILHYDLHPEDKKMSLFALEKVLELHEAACAKKAFLIHSTAAPIDFGKISVAEYVRGQKSKKGYFSIFSAHQMGTCRMGKDPALFPVSPEGKLRETENVFVCDASLFPAASGANPMMTVAALAKIVADGIPT